MLDFSGLTYLKCELLPPHVKHCSTLEALRVVWLDFKVLQILLWSIAI